MLWMPIKCIESIGKMIIGSKTSVTYKVYGIFQFSNHGKKLLYIDFSIVSSLSTVKRMKDA